MTIKLLYLQENPVFLLLWSKRAHITNTCFSDK